MGDSGGTGRRPQRSKFHFDNMHWKDPLLFGPVLLYQIGDLACEGNYTTGAHEQFCYEISLAVSGKGVFSTNGIQHMLKKGDMYVNRPGEVHDVVADKLDPIRYFYVAFNLEGYGSTTIGLKKALAAFDHTTVPVSPDRCDMKSAYVRVFNELINNQSFSEKLIEIGLTELIILAYRNLSCGSQMGYVPKTPAEPSRRVAYEVVNYIDSNLFNIADLTDLCSHFDYSYSRLTHIFSKEVGESISEYYEKKRFEAAAGWIADKVLSITEISEKLGYQSIHTFSRAFKQRFGCSPTQYRAQKTV